MQFSNPIFLWGLLGLSIPIGIHLLSRREGKTIKIGSIRHLKDTETKQFKSIRLNEVLLLILRCLLITALIFSLSGIHFSYPTKKENWLLIEEGLEEDQEFRALIDSLKGTGFKIKFLSSGFPDASDKSQVLEKVNYWKLVEDLNSQPLEDVVVLSYNYLKRFNGKRPTLPDNVRWISKDSAPIDFTLYARKTSQDSVLLRTGTSNSEAMRFSTAILNKSDRERDNDTVAIESSDTIRITIVSDTSFSNDKLMILTGLKVLEEKSKIVFQIESITPNAFHRKNQDWIFWITSAALSQPLRTDVIQFREDRHSEVLFRLDTRQNGHSLWLLTKRLNEEIAFEKNLALELGLVLLHRKDYSNKVSEFDRRVLPDQLSWGNKKTSMKTNDMTTASSSEHIMAAVLVVLLLTERLVAFKRNQ
jgi:hypothetical protein